MTQEEFETLFTSSDIVVIIKRDKCPDKQKEDVDVARQRSNSRLRTLVTRLVIEWDLEDKVGRKGKPMQVGGVIFKADDYPYLSDIIEGIKMELDNDTRGF